jgi:hypothetical protein
MYKGGDARSCRGTHFSMSRRLCLYDEPATGDHKGSHRLSAPPPPLLTISNQSLSDFPGAIIL